MKVLLDECLPKKLTREVAAEVVKTVPEMGWAGIVAVALGGAGVRCVSDERPES